ncbi:MAG TPA: outer membrane protein assembly factor BamA [Candidatus Azoamicus sp.]
MLNITLPGSEFITKKTPSKRYAIKEPDVLVYYPVKKIIIFGSKAVRSEHLVQPLIDGCTNYTGGTTARAVFNVLTNLRYFDYIDIRVRKKLLILVVKDRPYIKSIKIYGDEKKKTRSLLNKHKIIVGNIYEHPVLGLCRNRIQDWHFAHGFLNSEVFIHVTKEKKDKKSNAVNIQINIIKNNIFNIKKIKLKGNKFYSKRKIFSLLSNTQSRWMMFFNKTTVYIKSKLSRDIKKIKAFYLNRGFKEFYIKYVKIIKKKNERDLKIFIKISEGNRHRFGKLILVKISEKISKEFTGICKHYLKHSNLYSKAKVKRIKKKIHKTFCRSGINTDYTVKHKVLGINREIVDIIFFFKEHKRPKVRRINFIGNYITSDLALRKFFTHLEDSRLQMKKIHAAKREILRRGYAKKIKITLKKNQAKPYEVDVIIKIKERKINKIVAGCTYSEKDGISFSINSDFINFLGTGKDAILVFHKNQNLIDYSLTIVSPQFMGLNIDMTYNLFYKIEATNKNVLTEYSTNSFGLSMLYSFKLARNSRFHIILGFDRTYIRVPGFRFVPYLKSFINTYGVKYKEYFFTTAYVRSTLTRHKRFPLGTFNKIALKIATPFSKLKYYIINYDFMFTKRLSRDFFFNLMMNISYGNKYGDTEWYPFFKHFFLKGKNNVRGYGNKSLGPRNHIKELNLGGNFLVSLKFELYFPLPILHRKNLKSSFFFDIGQTYDTSIDFNSRPAEYPEIPFNSFLKYSCGLSLIWTTPVKLPIEVTIAYPLNATFLDKKKFFIFSLGVHHKR